LGASLRLPRLFPAFATGSELPKRTSKAWVPMVQLSSHHSVAELLAKRELFAVNLMTDDAEIPYPCRWQASQMESMAFHGHLAKCWLLQRHSFRL